MMNPVLVEVLRGGRAESFHRGAVAVFDADGGEVMALGDVDKPIFSRSAVKAIQALPLVESGAADAYGFGDRELALACASHNGEPAHVELARSMLARAGLGAGDLECGVHWPGRPEAARELACSGGTPDALHNNCSGKHSGFVCACRHMGLDHRFYVEAGHAYQEQIRETMAEVTGAAHGAENRGVDGCSIPTYAVPLQNLAMGFARMATGAGLARERARAAERLLRACMAEPFFVAGTDRADTALMQVAPGRIFVKIGAEGVFCAALPQLGLGIALKCDDGASRAAEALIAAILAKYLAGDAQAGSALTGLANPVLKNWNGIEVGALRPTAAIA